MDFFTFIAIAVFLFTFFSKKDKPPQRKQPRAEDFQPEPRAETREFDAEPRVPQPKRKETFFEQLERQLRESAESLERELQDKPVPVPRKTASSDTEQRPVPGHVIVRREPASPQRAEANVQTQPTQTQPQKPPRYETVTAHTATSIEDRIVSPLESAQPISQERIAGMFGYAASPVVQGIIWAEVLKEPKGRRGLSRR